jgi:hypothetical protein
MKISHIVGEHKKGVKAMKYGKKTKGAVPVYGPDAKDAKLKPVKPQGPGSKLDELDMTNSSAKVVNNDGKTITFAMPDGTQIQKPITPNTLSADKTGKPVVNMVPSAGTPPPTMGAAQPQSPEEIFAKGKDVTVNTGEPIEEIGEPAVGGMAMAAPGEKPAPEVGEPARPPALPAGQTFDPTIDDGGTAYRPGEAEWAEKSAAQGNLKRADALKNVDLNKSSYDPETGLRVTVTPGRPAPVAERKFKEALDAMLTIAGLR